MEKLIAEARERLGDEPTDKEDLVAQCLKTLLAIAQGRGARRHVGSRLAATRDLLNRLLGTPPAASPRRGEGLPRGWVFEPISGVKLDDVPDEAPGAAEDQVPEDEKAAE